MAKVLATRPKSAMTEVLILAVVLLVLRGTLVESC